MAVRRAGSAGARGARFGVVSVSVAGVRRVVGALLVAVVVAGACSSGESGVEEPEAGASGGAGVDEFGGESGGLGSDADGTVLVEFEELPGVATVGGGGEVRVSWLAAEPVSGSPVAGYEVQWARVGDEFGLSARAVVVGLSYTIWGLDGSSDYRVRVRPAGVQLAAAGGASVAAGAGSDPVAEVVEDAPGLGGSQRRSVSAFDGAVRFELGGDAVWPATISLPVDMDAVGDGDVQLAYFDEASGVWVPAPESVLDRQRGVITAEVYHLSLWRAICSVGLSGVCSKIVDVIDRGVQAINSIVASYWDAGTGWLRDGWQDAREFTLGDVPALAAAVVERLRETGAEVAPWALASLQFAAAVNTVDLRDLAVMVAESFGYLVPIPECDPPGPEWAYVQAELASGAVVLCSESAAGRGDDSDLMLTTTVNRGYAMIMRSNTGGVDFGDRSPEHVSVHDAQLPSQLTDLIASFLIFDNSKELFLPAGSSTRLRVPRTALGERSHAEFAYEADVLATTLQSLLYGINTLCQDKCKDIPQILQCAWGNIARFANEDYTTPQADPFEAVQDLTQAVREYKRLTISDCVAPSIPSVTKSQNMERILHVMEGLVLLHEYGRMTLDGTIAPTLLRKPHQVTITDTNPPRTPQTPTDTTTTTPQPPTTTQTPTSPATGSYTTISAGASHSCAVTTAGVAKCWGYNHDGQTDVPDGSYTTISAGSYHSCAVTTAGVAKCWGNDDFGKTEVPDGSYTAISAGGHHSCAVTTAGVAKCWGDNTARQTDVPDGSYMAISAGWDHSCAVTTAGVAKCWGDNGAGKTIVPDGSYMTISAGWDHSCAVTTAGVAKCWGDNDYGQTDVPDGSYMTISAGWGHSCAVTTAGDAKCWGRNDYGRTDVPDGSYMTISAGWGHSCAVTTAGVAKCWGRNDYGQTVVPDGSYMTISAGGVHSCAVTAAGVAKCWGFNDWGQTDVPDGSYTTISAGGLHSCAVTTAGVAKCWGDNDYGQTDVPDGSYTAISAGWRSSCAVTAAGVAKCWGQTVVPDGSYMTISAGYTHSCAVTTAGVAKCWGLNDWGQTDVPDGSYTAISAGGWYHSCAVTTAGVAKCWGDNDYGQTDVPDGSYMTISAGWGHSCAVTTAGVAKCWGRNDYGQTVVPDGSYMTISAGASHSCAVTTAGDAKCWGAYASLLPHST